MNFFTSALLLIIGTMLYTVCTNGQVILAPAGRHLCPQSGVTRLQKHSPYYPTNVLFALEQLTPGNRGNATPAESSTPQPRCRPEASRVFTKLFGIPGAVADSFLSGEIII